MKNNLEEFTLAAHNEFRSKHEGTAPLSYNEELAKMAQAHAEKMAKAGALTKFFILS